MKEELERSRSEASRVTREHERTREKLARERSTSAVRTAERDQAVTFAREVSEYAAEATQKVDELSRRTTAHVTQAKHLFEHGKLAERRIDEVDSEKQQYAAEVQGLREVVLSLEKRARETEGLVERLKYVAKMQHTKFTTKEQDLNAAVFRMHELETRVTLLGDENRTLAQKVGIQGAGEAALGKKLAEKPKDFDDLTARLKSMQTSQSMAEIHIRDEVTKRQQENLKLHI